MSTMDSEMSVEGPSFTEETASNMLKELQSWWEIPSIAQYISLFREAFNLPEIEIEELEKGLIDDCVKGPNDWLENLVIAFLKSIMPNRVNPTNWELQLKRLIKRKWAETPFAEQENPLAAEDKSFHDLNLRSKVEILYSFCLYRLDNNDITEAMKSMDADALRVQKLGIDNDGNTYWYFYGTRLYKEEPIEEKKTWDEEWSEQKRKSLTKKRGRGRPPKKKNSNFEKDVEEISKEDERFMNVSEKSRWSVACDTLEEWVNFAERFKNSKTKNEKSLFEIISENFLPTLSKIYEEKERKLQDKIKELLPSREKIVTRRETRRLRGDTGGDINYALLNGYDSEDEDYKTHNDYSMLREVKSRAERLEERNKRASENVQDMGTRKRMKQYDETKASSESSENSSIDNSENGELDVKSQMIKLLSKVMLHKDAWPFIYPVDKENAPGYYDIIQEPVDLTTIKQRLHKGEYETIGDLDADFSKMVSNCELYNGESHAFSKMAQTLRIFFRKEVSDLLEMMEDNAESSTTNSEESNDAQYNSSSNSNASSPPHDSPVSESKEHKKAKEKKKKRKHGRNMEALNMLAQASDSSIQDDVSDSSSPSQKMSPVHQDSSPDSSRPAPCYVPSTNKPCYAVASSSPSTNKTSIPATNSNVISVNSSPPGTVSATSSNFSSVNPSPQGVVPTTNSSFISVNPSSEGVVPATSSSFISVNSSSQRAIPVTNSSFISVNQSPQGGVPAKNSSFISVNQSPQGGVPAKNSSFISVNSSSQRAVPVTSSSIITVNPSPQGVVPVTNSNFISANSPSRGIVKNKPVIIKTKAVNSNKRNSVVENVATTSINTTSDQSRNISVQQTNINQPFHTQTVVLSRPTMNQSGLKIPNNPMTAVSMPSNICLPNGLPVVQQVVLSPGTQLSNTGQPYIIASPQNTIRIYRKDQGVSLQNSIGQLNQNFVKVVPQLITQPMQITKDGMQNFQLSPNNTQTFTQVAQNPQFVNVPYIVNQNSMTNSTSQPAVNYQSFQIPTRPMHIGGQGNG